MAAKWWWRWWLEADNIERGQDIEATTAKGLDPSSVGSAEWTHCLSGQGEYHQYDIFVVVLTTFFPTQYFGNVEVTQPKGIEVVKESITRLKLKKTEGAKIPKVELTISVNGVAIQDPKSKNMYTQFPLHRISYCADDKTAKKFFSFIAKDVEADKNLCFVFMSEKMSEEIILTIGQAFDLAYAKFIESSGRELEIRKQLIMLQKKVCDLEEENQKLKTRLGKYEPAVLLAESSKESNTKVSTTPAAAAAATTTATVEVGKQTNGHKNGATSPPVMLPPPLQPPPSSGKARQQPNQLLSLIDVDLDDVHGPPPPAGPAPLISPPNAVALLNSTPVVGAMSLLNEDLFDEDFDPRAGDEDGQPATNTTTATTTTSSGGGGSTENGKEKTNQDMFGSEPFQDPFGMEHFTSAQLNSAIVSIDKTLAEMRVSILENSGYGSILIVLSSCSTVSAKV